MCPLCNSPLMRLLKGLSQVCFLDLLGGLEFRDVNEGPVIY
jgi:hypothetical protein